MKKFVRVIALVLACLFCTALVAACNDTGAGTEGGNNYRGAYFVDENGVRWQADAWGYLRQYDNLPDDIDYQDKEVTVLYWSDVEKIEFDVKEESIYDRESAIYNRNLAVQQRLGVKLAWKSFQGSSNYVGSFTSQVQSADDSNTHDYDIIATYSRTAGNLLINGLLYDIASIEDKVENPNPSSICGYIDLNQPWWPASLIDDMKIGNSLYFLSGDISVTAIDEMHCIYFNKELVDTAFEEEAIDVLNDDNATGTQLLYNYVRSGKWTVDKMVEMASGHGNDNNGDGVLDSGDNYGMCSADYCAATIYGSANLRMIEHDDAKTLVVSDNYTSTRTIKLVRTMGTLFRSDDYYDKTYADAEGASYYDPFNNGRSLFILNYIELGEALQKNEAIDHYGLVPMPKYDENQTNYYTVIGNAFSIFTIFGDFDTRGDEKGTAQMLSAVLECWASEAFRKTTPVVFELNLQLKYSETQDETDMCEYVRRGICFDIGRIIDHLMGFQLDGQVFFAAFNGESWVASYSSHIGQVESKLEDFVESLNSGNN